jgi:hypothetical protein
VNEKLIGVDDHSLIEGHPYNGVDYFHLMVELNRVIYEVANDNKYGVIELTTLPIWEECDFYDFTHMTPSGAQKVGIEMFKQINDKIK